MLQFGTRLENYFTEDYFNSIIKEYIENKPDVIEYVVELPIYGIVDKEKLLEKMSEEIDKNNEQLLSNENIDKKDLTELIKKLNSDKILYLSEAKKDINSRLTVFIKNQYKLDIENFPVNILKTNNEFYTNILRPILIYH